MLVLIGFVGGIAWRDKGPAPALDDAPGLPEVRTRGSYEIISVDESDGFPVIDVRLNAKVPREVLEEIALELKPKRPTRLGLFFMYYYLPGVEPADHRRWENWHPWGITISYPAFRTRIVGLTIEEEGRLRNKPLALPDGGQALGTWLSEDWIHNANLTHSRNSGLSDKQYDDLVNLFIDSHRLTIYRNTLGKWRVLFDGDEKPTPLELKETPSDGGIAFVSQGGVDRYVIDPQGTLRVYSNDGELMSVPEPIKPPIAPTRGITEKEFEGIGGPWIELVKQPP